MTQEIDDLDRWEVQEWDIILKRLTAYTHRRLGRGGRIQDAEDIAMQAITRVMDPEYRDWDPAEGPLLWHLRSEVNGIVKNLRRTRSRTEEVITDPTGRNMQMIEHHSGVVDRINAGDILTAVLELIAERHDHVAEQVFSQALSGIVAAKEVATACNLTLGQVNEARRRLSAYYKVVLLRQEGSDG